MTMITELLFFVAGVLIALSVWYIVTRFESKAALHIETKQGKDGRWRYHLKGPNGHDAAISTGDGWETEYAAILEANRIEW